MASITITRKEMLERMETGEIFSIKWCTYDSQKKKGGEQKEYPEAVLMREIDKSKEPQLGNRPMTKNEIIEEVRKNPNHRKHFTRNIRMMINGEPTGIATKIHIRLVEEFNGMKIIV